ncbi:VOC family protein [Micrococcales bacterium 31B]|nr:VOC family protein [Micrococcales bacterium 31B]
MTGLPGMRGTDHIGFTVPNIDEAHEFLVNVLGCTEIYRLGPFLPRGSWMSEHLNVDDSTTMRQIRFYRLGNGSNFEVFEYEAEGAAEQPPRNSDVGGHHLGIYVDDLDAAVDYLRSHNVRILGEPTASNGASKGQRWVYFLAPWGMQFELVSFPGGKAYEAEAPVRLWDARD